MSKSTYRRRFKTGRELFGEKTVTEEELERMKAGARLLLRGSNEDDQEANDDRRDTQKALAESLANEMEKRQESDINEESEVEETPEGPDTMDVDDFSPFKDT